MRSVDEILKAMRGLVVNSGIHDGDMVDATAVHHAILQYADELEGAWKRERVEVATRAATQAVNLTNEKIANSPVGNSLAMREAIEKIVRIAEAWKEPGIHAVQTTLFRICEAARAALAEQPRRCDVYDPDNAAHMMEVDYCGSMPSSHCDGMGCTRCSFKWFTSPVEKGGEK